jgi:hypothetical protein
LDVGSTPSNVCAGGGLGLFGYSDDANIAPAGGFYMCFGGPYQCSNGDCPTSGVGSYFRYPSYSNSEIFFIATGGLYSTQTYCSDSRIKTEVETIENALDTVRKLEPVEFNWNDVYLTMRGSLPAEKHHAIGFIAQKVQTYLPELVRVNPNTGYYEINYGTLNSILVEAIKEQQVFIEDINTQIVELENILK